MEAMQNNEMSFLMTWSLWDACSIRKAATEVAVLALYSKPENMCAYGLDLHLQKQW